MSRYKRFAEFYPFYLSQHQHPVCRKLHFFGTLSVIVAATIILATQWWVGLIGLPLLGYFPAWIGHFFFEKNRPATFQHPFYSLVGDFVMFWESSF